MTQTMIQTTDIDFETHVEKVKDIIKQLNDNTLNLKDGMKLYKDAQTHINMANKMLEEAEFELKNALEQQ
ncbi:exodeoxyribonuclease VII small subunit [Helicobacter bilis]|uniref:exodeoxyribonuclease VII small subunit n=2 Tax=Helicobacter TaxID=209 RepID=UPI0025583ADF|nr:exodeoxyribonuclease VII small subunit [Helicobacter bilis]